MTRFTGSGRCVLKCRFSDDSGVVRPGDEETASIGKCITVPKRRGCVTAMEGRGMTGVLGLLKKQRRGGRTLAPVSKEKEGKVGGADTDCGCFRGGFRGPRGSRVVWPACCPWPLVTKAPHGVGV